MIAPDLDDRAHLFAAHLGQFARARSTWKATIAPSAMEGIDVEVLERFALGVSGWRDALGTRRLGWQNLGPLGCDPSPRSLAVRLTVTERPSSP